MLYICMVDSFYVEFIHDNWDDDSIPIIIFFIMNQIRVHNFSENEGLPFFIIESSNINLEKQKKSQYELRSNFNLWSR